MAEKTQLWKHQEDKDRKKLYDEQAQMHVVLSDH